MRNLAPLAIWLLPPVLLTAAGGVWVWSGSFGPAAVTLLLTGDINIEQRADPTTAFLLTPTADKGLVWANLPGLWRHVEPNKLAGPRKVSQRAAPNREKQGSLAAYHSSRCFLIPRHSSGSQLLSYASFAAYDTASES